MENAPTTPTPTPTNTGTPSELYDSLLELVQPWIPLLVAVAVAAIVLAIATPWLIHRYIAWKEVYGYSRLEAFLAPYKAIYRGIYKLIKKEPPPRPYRVIQPRELLQAKEDLMKHPSIKSALIAKDDESLWIVKRDTVTRNIYEGSLWNGDSKVVGTKEVPKTYRLDFATSLSPYPRTVKDLTRAMRGKYNSTDNRYLPRVQARIMADRLIVRKTTDTEALGLLQPKDTKYKYGFFIIEIYATHSTPEEVLKLEPAIKAALKLENLKQLEVTSNRVTWLALKPGVKSALSDESMPTGIEFIKKNPVTDKGLGDIPMAVAATGKPWILPMHHTLLVGKSGAGKSSLLNMTCAQLAPAIIDGRAKVYAIDPKGNGEARTQWARAGAFEMAGNVDNIDEWVHIINVFYDLMESQPIDDTKFTAETLNEQALKVNTFKASKEKPLHILFIEELPGFVDAIDTHPEGAHVISKVNQILRKGRSLGFYIFSAAQNIERGTLGGIDAKGFINKIALALNDTEYLNKLILGEDSIKRGYDARKLNPSNKNPDHRGLGYAKGETGDPVMVRFPYFDHSQLVQVLLPLVEASNNEEGTDSPAVEPLDSDSGAPAQLEEVTTVDMGDIDYL